MYSWWARLASSSKGMALFLNALSWSSVTLAISIAPLQLNVSLILEVKSFKLMGFSLCMDCVYHRNTLVEKWRQWRSCWGFFLFLCVWVFLFEKETWLYSSMWKNRLPAFFLHDLNAHYPIEAYNGGPYPWSH